MVIQMGGGNDGLDTFIPVGDPRYYTLRASANYAADATLPIAPGFGFHPALGEVEGQVRRGQGRGRPGRRQPSGPRPQPLHVDRGVDAGLGRVTGLGRAYWLARALSGRLAERSQRAAPGGHDLVVGAAAPPRRAGTAAGLPQSIGGAFGLDRRAKSDAAMFDAFKGFGGSTGLGTWGDAAGKAATDTMTVAAQIQPAYVGAMPSTDLGRQLVTCARLINADLGIRVLNVTIGGFDNHTDLRGDHSSQLAELDGAIETLLHHALLHLRLACRDDDLLRVRTPAATNSDGGADHGTAGTHFIIGDQVKGGLYGAQPSLAANVLDNNGNLVSTVDFRQYYATVLSDWLAADPTQILGRTYSSLGVFRGLPAARRPRPRRRLRRPCSHSRCPAACAPSPARRGVGPRRRPCRHPPQAPPPRLAQLGLVGGGDGVDEGEAELADLVDGQGAFGGAEPEREGEAAIARAERVGAELVEHPHRLEQRAARAPQRADDRGGRRCRRRGRRRGRSTTTGTASSATKSRACRLPPRRRSRFELRADERRAGTECNSGGGIELADVAGGNAVDHHRTATGGMEPRSGVGLEPHVGEVERGEDRATTRRPRRRRRPGGRAPPGSGARIRR